MKKINVKLMKGCYCLIIEVSENMNLKVGSRLEIDFKKGYYVYIGSAMNGLESRVKRHLSASKKMHWHIDYLLKEAKIVEILYNEDKKVECELSQVLAIDNYYVNGFGCSDCGCDSHLYYFKNKNKAIEAVINAYDSIACNFRIGISDFS